MEGLVKTVEWPFYQGKRVLITGHTGFKGSWLCRLLVNAGAQVYGYSLEPSTEPSLFDLAGINSFVSTTVGDVRDYESLKKTIDSVKPEIIFHLAAQPIVRESYKDPRYTYETNVMGTVNLLEAVRNTKTPPDSVLNITTDKVYFNNEWCWGYREIDPLDGFDPYSNSKSCSELVTHSYKRSFFDNSGIHVSTARAGNVIGGGDFAKDRIIPDCVRAMQAHSTIRVRNPYSTRPYQHVLEPLAAYMMIAEKQYSDGDFAGYYNVGPDDCDCISTGELVDKFCKCWGEDAEWEDCSEKNAPHEASFLKLDCSKIKQKLNWKPHWHIDECMERTVEFSKIWLNGGNLLEEMDREIDSFMEAR